MQPLAGDKFFGDDADAHLHGCVEYAVDRGAEHDQLADVNRVQEVKAVDRSGDDRPAGVAHGGHGRGEIDQVHDLAAQHVAQTVGIVGKRQLDVFGGGIADWFAGRGHRSRPRLCAAGMPSGRREPGWR